MCEPVDNEVKDVVVDFLMSKWPNIDIDCDGDFINVRLRGALFTLLFDGVGVWMFGNGFVVDYDDPLFFKELESWMDENEKFIRHLRDI